MISSEKRDRCIIRMDRSAASSRQKSRSPTPSRLFWQTPFMPRVSAASSRSMSKVVPASAQQPSGETFIRAAHSEILSQSRSSIMA